MSIACYCKGCDKRTKDCHIACEDYKAYTKALGEKRTTEYKKRIEENMLESIQNRRNRKD